MRASRIVLAVLLTVALASSASAFDGKRKGFVLGGGLGVAPVAGWDDDHSGEDFGPGLGIQFIIGYAWNGRNMIVYEGNVVGWESKVGSVSFNVVQGFNGVSWYHYYGPKGGTIFSVLGAGAYVLDWDYPGSSLSGSHDPGGGVLIGGGYEFSPHWQAGLYVSGGKTSAGYRSFKHVHVSALVSGVAF